jgi:hypothetical protein
VATPILQRGRYMVSEKAAFQTDWQ